MNRLTNHLAHAAAALALLLCAAAIHAAEPISGTLKGSPEGEVTITVVRGQVTVIGVDGDEVSVEGTRDAASERFIFERTGDRVTIEDKLARRSSPGAGTQLTVRVPRGSRLRVNQVSADLDVQEVRGKTRLATVSGAIVARSLGADVEINTVSGSVTVDGAAGDVRLQTVSGRIGGALAASRLSVQTISGDVELTNRHPLVRGRLTSISGDLTLGTPLDAAADVEVETVSGDATLNLAGTLDLRLNLSGGPGGRIENRLSDAPVQKPGFGVGQRLETVIGDGRGYLRAATVNGRLTVAGG
jgi:DUF4097 and DUF4098 domain-containing protein YvlB